VDGHACLEQALVVIATSHETTCYFVNTLLRKESLRTEVNKSSNYEYDRVRDEKDKSGLFINYSEPIEVR